MVFFFCGREGERRALLRRRLLCRWNFRLLNWVLSGGFFWTWKRILNGTLFTEEGLWINSRMLVFQVAMLIVGVAEFGVLLWSAETLAQRSDAAREDLSPLLPQWVVDLYPTGRMVRRSLFPASLAAGVVVLILLAIYIPRCVIRSGIAWPPRRSHQLFLIVSFFSAVKTVLKYRCQLLPSLGSPQFNKYRITTDLVSLTRSSRNFSLSC